MNNALGKIAHALAELDSYEGVPPDDAPLMIDHDNCMFELLDQNSKRLTLGTLRALVAHLKA